MKKPTRRVVDLEVTEDIIDRAVRADSTACVLADALKIAMPGGQRAVVDLQTISVTVPEKGLRYHWLTPKPAQRLLLNFDHGAELLPETIRLRNGWTTPIRKRTGTGTTRTGQSRGERKADLEAREVAGTITGEEQMWLTRMRQTDERQSRPREADRTQYQGRVPAATLSNTRMRKYGLRLTMLTKHGEALVNDPAKP